MVQNPSSTSVFTPFFRRFTDERAEDFYETKALYDQITKRHKASKYADGMTIFSLGGDIYNECGDLAPPLNNAFADTIYNLLTYEKTIFDCPVADVAKLSLKESVDLKRYLRSKEHFLDNEEKVIAALKGGLSLIFRALARMLPATVDPSPFTIPLIYTLPEPRALIEQVIGTLWSQKFVEHALFVEITQQIYRNFCAVSDMPFTTEPKRAFKYPSKNNAPLDDIVRAYLGGTALKDFFLTPVPLKFTYEDRFNHTHICGGSGAGKTQLLQHLILHDLQSENSPALVIVDSQGDLISKILKLDIPGLHERLVLISPKDIKNPPALNIFSIPKRVDGYDEVLREQVVAGVIETFDYLFTGLVGADLTAKQGVFFRYVARLMLSFPETMGRNATILDMIELMENAEP